MTDPFAHHPRLRDLITPPGKSKMRDITTAQLKSRLIGLGIDPKWLYPDDQREAMRRDRLSQHYGDLWVFAYGSLIWDPAFHFIDVRRAHVSNHARRFILRDDKGSRGDTTQPGLMAALDRCPAGDPGCDGLAFRIAAADVDAETSILWQREMIGPAYHAEFVTAQINDGAVQALTFVADHAAQMIDAGITRSEQVRNFAKATGFFGTSYDYLANLAHRFDTLGIYDPHITDLLAEVDAFRAA